MSAYMNMKTWDELIEYLKEVDQPKCFTVNYLPDSDEFAIWIGNQPFYEYEKLIELEQQERKNAVNLLYKENQWLYGKLNQIDDIIKRGREESKRFE